MQAYGFSRITTQQLNSGLKPVAGKKHVIDDKPKEGAAANFEITGLIKELSKVFGSNIIYCVAHEGHGDIATNLDTLGTPSVTEYETLGCRKVSEENKVYHIGEDTEPPYYTVLIESEDLYGEKLGLGMHAGAFSLDGVKGETLDDDNFTPEPGKYVYFVVSRQTNDKRVTVGFADNSEALAELTTGLFGEETPAPEK